MTFWAEAEGWAYEYFGKDTHASTFSGFEEMVELWQKRAGERDMPSWSDFDFYDFKGWHGRVNVIDVSLDPFEFKYRLFGSVHSELVEEDFTNKNSREVEAKNHLSDFDYEFYEMVARKGLIARSTGRFHYNWAKGKKVIYLELPLSDGGGTVTHQLEFLILEKEIRKIS